MNGNSGLGLAAGLMQGFAQGRMMKMEREERDKARKEASEKNKLLMKGMEIKLLNDKMKLKQQEELAAQRKAFMQRFGLDAGGGQPAQTGDWDFSGAQRSVTPFGESFQNEPGLTDQLAKSSVMGDVASSMSPQDAALAKMLFDIDFPGAIRNETAIKSLEQRTKADQQRDEDRDRAYQLDVARFEREGGKLEGYNFVGPDGKKYQGIRNVITKEPVKNQNPIPQEPPKGPPGEMAGRINSMITAKDRIKSMKSVLFGPDGKIDKMALASASVGDGVGKGRELKSNFREAVDGIVRVMTGAAVREDEWPFYESQFLPSVLDLTQPGLIEQKLKRFEDWTNNYIKLTDPTGKYRASVLADRYETPEDVQVAFQSGWIDKKTAVLILKNKFGME